MPWTHCELPNVPDSDPCPSCKISEPEWTVNLDATRTFRVAIKSRPKKKSTRPRAELRKHGL